MNRAPSRSRWGCERLAFRRLLLRLGRDPLPVAGIVGSVCRFAAYQLAGCSSLASVILPLDVLGGGHFFDPVGKRLLHPCGGLVPHRCMAVWVLHVPDYGLVALVVGKASRVSRVVVLLAPPGSVLCVVGGLGSVHARRGLRADGVNPVDRLLCILGDHAVV